ncbi:hypothetical protein HELRODRAFT_171055 [Helobdella robusta]|uniref:Uncharacterized protein n=1 Tax=Helobdella robusta TaxID=6412 RepID=T1F3R7_HELRO|nr:hypothetical protein HELRODRAFT_171055 [Helobdella robusta]ESO07017.1 hypothetical protein HELRODRAFT_171055 [Helobdella robusta]
MIETNYFFNWIKQKFTSKTNKRFAGATLDTEQFSYEVFRNGKQHKNDSKKVTKLSSPRFSNDNSRPQHFGKNLKLELDKKLNGLDWSKPDATDDASCEPSLEVSNSEKHNTLTRFRNKLRSSFAGISSFRRCSIEPKKGRFSDVGILPETMVFPKSIEAVGKESHPSRLFSLTSSSSSTTSPHLSALALPSLTSSSSSSISTIASSDSYFPDKQETCLTNCDRVNKASNMTSLIGVKINAPEDNNLSLNRAHKGVYDNLPEFQMRMIPITSGGLKHKPAPSKNIFPPSTDSISEYVYCNTDGSFTEERSVETKNLQTSFLDFNQKHQPYFSVPPKQNLEIDKNNSANEIEDNYCLQFDTDLPFLPPKTYKRSASDNQLKNVYHHHSHTPEKSRPYSYSIHSHSDRTVRNFSNLSRSVALKCELFCQKVDEMANVGYIPMKVRSFHGST